MCSSSGNSATGLPPATGPSSYIIYRDHKYYGLAKRVFHYSLVLIRFYITEPALKRLNQVQNYVLELCGFILLLLLAPVLGVTALCVSVPRRMRIGLIRQFYPTLNVCDDFSLRSTFTATDADASIVIAVIWVDGRVTANDLQTRYQTHRPTDPWILEKCIDSKFGIMVAREPEHASSFDVSHHIVNVSSAAAIVYNPCAYDIDENSQHGPKARLQKLIAGILSKKMRPEYPPWEIALIPVQIPVQQQQHPQHSRTKYKTCCILRFHHVLLRDRKVNQFLDGAFDKLCPGKRQAPSSTQDPLATIQIGLKILKLRLSQWTIRSPSIAKIACADFKLEWRDLHYLYVLLVYCLRVAWSFTRCLSSIPIELLQCSIWKSRHAERAFGFSKFDTSGQSELAWSGMNKSLVETIKEKTGQSATTESVLLCAISMGLNQYYVDTSLRNPGALRIAIPTISSSGFKSVAIRTNTVSRSSYGSEKYVLWSNLLQQPYPEWRLFGSDYLYTYISRVMPRCLARVVIRSSYRRHPIQITFIDSTSKPVSIWDHLIEEISYWDASAADDGSSRISVCLVNSSETLRLIVHSPMKLLATSLTRYLDTYLNEIADMVGVEKSRIPYHRKLSLALNDE